MAGATKAGRKRPEPRFFNVDRLASFPNRSERTAWEPRLVVECLRFYVLSDGERRFAGRGIQAQR
jgi:hypothetical protein